jgi:hypothetical protein
VVTITVEKMVEVPGPERLVSVAAAPVIVEKVVTKVVVKKIKVKVGKKAKKKAKRKLKPRGPCLRCPSHGRDQALAGVGSAPPGTRAPACHPAGSAAYRFAVVAAPARS